MKNVYTVVVFLGLSLFLSGCLLDGVEKLTEETRDEVRATNDAIHAQEDMVKISRMHSSMVDTSMSPSVRVNAAKAVLAKWPENMLASDLGMLLPSFKMPSLKKPVDGTEIEFLNVPYVGNKKISARLGVACIDVDLMNIVAFAAAQLSAELEAKTKMAGITAAEMDNYRAISRRLVVIVPAILGAVSVEPMEQALEALLKAKASGSLQPAAVAEQLQTTARSGTRWVPSPIVKSTVAALEQLAVNTALDEAEINEMRALISLRLGIN